MLYRKFGKTNEQVSALGFGCMRLPVIGGDPTRIDEEKAIAMIRYAIDQGVNYVDTAFPYHGSMKTGGQSEPLVAKALKDGYRQKVNLATKLPGWLAKTRELMDKYLNLQLERLQTDTIDFYLVHSLNAYIWPILKAAGIGDFLDQAIKDGRIRYAGFSFHDKLDLFKEIVDSYDWSFCQIQYNYMDEDFQAGKEGLLYAAQKGLGIAIMEPLRGGKLAVNIPGEVQEVFDGAAVKWTPAEWALRWVWNHPEVSVVLSGMTTMDNVVENIRTAKEAKANSLSAEELTVIEQAKSAFRKKIKVNCTTCGYCMPCPSGVDIPGCLGHYNDYFIYGNPDTKQDISKAGYFELGPKQRASRCAECGICEEHCPQSIPIREELKRIKDFFEPEGASAS